MHGMDMAPDGEKGVMLRSLLILRACKELLINGLDPIHHDTERINVGISSLVHTGDEINHGVARCSFFAAFLGIEGR
jgi:hypothetical protein